MIMMMFYYVLFAALIFMSTRENSKVLFYFGFLRGRFSKTLFLLFCACIIFPTSKSNSDSNDLFNRMVGWLLIVVAIL